MTEESIQVDSFSESKAQVTSSNCSNQAEGSDTRNTVLWKKLREGGRHSSSFRCFLYRLMYLCVILYTIYLLLANVANRK